MDNTLDALRNLYAALGGTPSDVANMTIIPEIVNAIATHLTAGGAAELPTVTADDDGKILKVINGAWGKAAGGAKVVNGSLSGSTITFEDETEGGIVDAVLNGENVIVKVTDTSGSVTNEYVFYVSRVSRSSSRTTVTFVHLYRSSDTASYFKSFYVIGNSSSTMTTMESARSDDYSSGGPI